MIRFKKVFFWIFFLAFISISQAQILSISEKDRNGKKYEVKDDAPQIVDINSIIEVKVSKDELLKIIKNQFPQLAQQADLDIKIADLKKALELHKEALAILENNVATVSDKQQFFGLMDQFLNDIRANANLLKQYNDLTAEFFSLNTNNSIEGGDMEAYIFKNLNGDLAKFQAQLKSIDSSKFTISVVAYKKDKDGGDRVHIQNYDTYSERDYFTVERWVSSMTDAQTQAFSALSATASENNAKSTTIFESLKATFIAQFPSITCVQEQVTAFKTFINDPNLTTDITSALSSKGNELLTEFNTLLSDINSLKAKISGLDITLIFDIENEYKKLVNDVKSIEASFTSFKTITDAITSLEGQVTGLAANFTTCIGQLKTDFNSLKNPLALLSGHQKNYIANKNIGDEVKRFNIANLPEKGIINLKGTGKRVNGDELLIEVLLLMPSSKEGMPSQKFTLEQRLLTMQLIGFRSQVAVGLIMANPTKRSSLDFTPKREFFYTPSASLLLKIGSRKSYFYNEFIDLGIGINFASPDFDSDGTPEFGTGLIFTAFKNILSVGYNYNITLDTPYWFFGVHLPFNLPGLPINTVK